MTPAEELSKSKKPRHPRPGVEPKLSCKLRLMRQELKLSLQDVAKQIGVSTPTLSRAERGDDLLLSHALLIAAFFGQSIENLWHPICNNSNEPMRTRRRPKNKRRSTNGTDQH